MNAFTLPGTDGIFIHGKLYSKKKLCLDWFQMSNDGFYDFGNPNCGYTWGFQIVYLSGPKPNIDTLCWFDMEEGGAYSEIIGTVFDEEAPQ